MDHATGTICLYNMGALHNIKSELCGMNSMLWDIRSALSNIGMRYVISMGYDLSYKIIDFFSTIYRLYVVQKNRVSSI